MKRLAIATALALTALTASASPAAAAEITVTSIVCPDTYKSAWVPAGSPGDKNLNGAVCVKAKRSVDELLLVTVTVNVESGGCPAGQHAVPAAYRPAADQNQNSIVCYEPTGKGSWNDDTLVPTAISFQ